MNVLSASKLETLVASIYAGLSLRSAAKFAEVDRKTARRYFHALPPLACPCGRDLPHQCWCSYRVARSPMRQQFLSRFASLKDETRATWRQLAAEVDKALANKTRFCSIELPHIKELKRFYQPAQRGFVWSDDRPNVVAIVEPDQENTSCALYAALDNLHPKVKAFVLSIVDGATVEDAASEVGLLSEDLSKIMPPLKVFLRPYLGGSQ